MVNLIGSVYLQKNLKPLNEVQVIADELKVIISNKNDFKWAIDQSNKVK